MSVQPGTFFQFISAPKKKWSAQLTVLVAKVLKSLLLRTKCGQLTPPPETARAVVNSCSEYLTLKHFIFSVG